MYTGLWYVTMFNDIELRLVDSANSTIKCEPNPLVTECDNIPPTTKGGQDPPTTKRDPKAPITKRKENPRITEHAQYDPIAK